MASLSFSLPPPRRSKPPASSVRAPSSTAVVATEAENAKNETTASAPAGNVSKTKAAPKAAVPNYKERCAAAAALAKMKTPQERKAARLFVPRSVADFEDGGAFPEIHVAQYPRHMGNPHLQKKAPPTNTKDSSSSSGVVVGRNSASRAIVPVEIDKDGQVSYDAIVKRGTNSDKIVYTKHSDMVGGEAKPEDIALPDAETERATAERTQAALQRLIESKTALSKPSGSAIQNAETSKNMEEKTQFIKYTPRPDAPGYNPAAAQRVIQMVPAQVDPMMPPKHKFVKAPQGPAEDPVPILHAPPTKLTKEEREKWNVPACISNWKNMRGFVIPLDKRLAADGRGLRETSINPNFATLAESLYVAERQARQEVKLRAQVHKKLALQEKEKREEELRELANQARRERSGLHHDADEPAVAGNVVPDRQVNEDSGDDWSDEEDGGGKERAQTEDTDEMVAARQRDRLRLERKRQRERELRMEKNMDLKKQKLESERDVSEKVALGVHTGSGGGDQVDSRLYNQTGGMDSGFGADDEYNAYSKPLFNRAGVTSASIYRPTRGETEYNADETYDKLLKGATSKFQPAKGFAGAEGGGDVQAGPRSAPVQFEKSKN